MAIERIEEAPGQWPPYLANTCRYLLRRFPFFVVFPDATFGDARHFVAGDRGVSEWIFTGTTADGKKVEVNGCDIFTFQNDKIAVKSSFFKNRTA